MYAFFTTLPIIDLQQRQTSGPFAGLYVDNPFAGGGITSGSNPWQTFELMLNDEDVNRYIVSSRVNYNAYSSAAQNLQLSYVGGIDRSTTEAYLLAPSNLQFQRPGTNRGIFPGTAIQGNGSDRLNNHAANLVHTLTGWSKYLTATTSVGLQAEDRSTIDYNVIGRGLIPGQVTASPATNTTVTNTRAAVLNQAFYAQEEVLALDERLLISAAVRGERSSVNGDYKKLHYFPRVAASYRVPTTMFGGFGDFVSEFKLRAAYGQSGNQPAYGEKFITLTNAGQIGGQTALIQAATLGNPNVTPERLSEQEYGTEISMWRERVRLEGTYFNRRVTDLLVRPFLASSSGVNTQVINGGVMTSKGLEAGVTLIPVQMRAGSSDLSWTSRTTYFTNDTKIESFPVGVRPFTVLGGGFGASFGRLRQTAGYPVSMIWGNKTIVCPAVTVGACAGRPGAIVTVDTALGDANPDFTMGFSNEIAWGNLTLSSVLDWRKGGLISSLSLFSFDDGAVTWDFDDPAPAGEICPSTNLPCTTTTLGPRRLEKMGNFVHVPAYLLDGSYVKIRELSLSYDVPTRYLQQIPALNTRNLRLSLSGRNLAIFSDYNGFDPEGNNGGNNVARMVDLAQWPSTRNVFFSVDIGF